MLYLHDGHIREIGVDWGKLIGLIEEVIRLKDADRTSHPLKPYLRFPDEPANRIIAMPAYVGGSFDIAGIKWIASFPGNRLQGLPRAHNTILLNDSSTGKPIAFIHSGMLNAIRTASVSGLMLRAYLAARRQDSLRVGIIGWGPIGRLHLEMVKQVVGDKLERVALFDLNGIDPSSVPADVREMTVIADDWRTVYRSSDIFATCTVASERYIDEAPPPGALLLNISLRDYQPASAARLKAIVIDDWKEVCRENTDVEQLHLQYQLQESDTRSIADVVCRNALSEYDAEEPIYFNPMGLAVFDIAIAQYYVREAVRSGIGIPLEE
ncbi:2,3-diaminopropionate biosynthesis protein SbnB [Paenibacillus sp. OAS669]|uniref:2,3-diaminopropionate biosynthesis protein SbnB n=1 Tax=Paenibacillus sp. OAS669 TaxID=2663821 RepID=UPI00178B09D1|nr:2,3-diaminopropionate biosynthesis protein SbnB [Paenibacillus sp. OAS669]MBE1444138.1 ornithine cyclodeaminase [Paenibacillus sp. OAS669]